MALQIILQQITLQTKMRQRTEVEGPLDGVMVVTRVQLTRPLTNACEDQCPASSAAGPCVAAWHWCAPVRCVHPQTFQNNAKHFSVFLAQSQFPFFGANLLAGSDVMFIMKTEEARPTAGCLCKGQHDGAEPPSDGLFDLCCGFETKDWRRNSTPPNGFLRGRRQNFFTLPPHYRSLG